MTAANLDRTDLLVLAELQRNGRQTNAELAERVGNLVHLGVWCLEDQLVMDLQQHARRELAAA